MPQINKVNHTYMYIYLIGVLEQFNLLSLFGCCIDRVSFPGSEPRKKGTNNSIKNRQQQQHMTFSFQRPILWLQPMLVAIWLSLQSFIIVDAQSTVEDWYQIGLDINGEARGDYFGSSLTMSADGTVFAVGATYNKGDANLFGSGHVRVYETKSSNRSSYEQLGSDINGKLSDNQFGYALVMSANGTTLAISASRNNMGVVRIYQKDTFGPTYQQIGSDLNGTIPGDLFGNSLAMSADGTIIAIGAILTNDNGDGRNYVRVYQKNSIHSMYQSIGSDIYGKFENNDRFSASLAMSADGTILAVGATEYGYVRIYQMNSFNQTYQQIGRELNGERFTDQFGHSLAMSANGTTLAVGAIFTMNNGTLSGQVRVYQRDEFNATYRQVGSDIEGTKDGDFLGWSMAMSADGTRIAVSELQQYNSGVPPGRVRVYQQNSSLSSSDPQFYQPIGGYINGVVSRDSFGYSLAMSDDGTIVAVGARGSDFDRGQVRVFTYSQPPTASPLMAPLPSTQPSPPSRSPTTTTTSSPATMEPTQKPCGILGWSIFCPFTFRGILGRWLRRLFE